MTVLVGALAAFIGVGSLLIGAFIDWRWHVPQRVIAGTMAFAAGVLISTLAIALVNEASISGGVWPVAAGVAVGAALYVGGDQLLVRMGRRHRPEGKSRNIAARRGGDTEGGGLTVVLGALLDGVPEAMVIGVSAISGNFPGAMVAAIGLSNVPEGLGGTATLRRSGRSFRTVFLLWGGVTVFAMVAAVVGALVLDDASPTVMAVIMSLAAGGILAMICNSMIPEAFDEDHWATGLFATVGFLAAFAIHELL